MSAFNEIPLPFLLLKLSLVKSLKHRIQEPSRSRKSALARSKGGGKESRERSGQCEFHYFSS
jgi:hypothetical protein